MTPEFTPQPEQLAQEVILSPAQQYALNALHLRDAVYDTETKISPLQARLYGASETERAELQSQIDSLRDQATEYETQATLAFYSAYDEEAGDDGKKYRSGQLSDEQKIRYEAERQLETLKNFTYEREYFIRSKLRKRIYEAETGETPIVIKSEEFGAKFKKLGTSSLEETIVVADNQEEEMNLLERVKKGIELFEDCLLSFAASRSNLYSLAFGLVGTGANADSEDTYKRYRAMSPKKREDIARKDIEQAAVFYDDLVNQRKIPGDVIEEVQAAREQDPIRSLDQILWEVVDRHFGIDGDQQGGGWIDLLRGIKRRTKPSLPRPLFDPKKVAKK